MGLMNVYEESGKKPSWSLEGFLDIQSILV